MIHLTFKQGLSPPDKMNCEAPASGLSLVLLLDIFFPYYELFKTKIKKSQERQIQNEEYSINLS